jgi:serine/threonine protein kinase
MQPGTRLAHFEVAEPIGSGAMSEVYLARDVQLNLPVAVKVVSARLLATDADARSRFEKEAQAAARLTHHNICRVYYYGVENGWPFYAMELIRGVSLQQVIDQRLRLSWAQILDITVQAVRGLRHASEANIAHRDVKPANLMIGRDGAVKVVDFGLSTWHGTNPYLSDRGLVVGTPSYISPEVIRRQPVDWRGDQYSLGVSLYHVLMGHLPYEGEDANLVMRMHLDAPVPDLRDRDALLPPRICRMVRRMMSKEPDERFGSYDEILQEIDLLHEELAQQLEAEIAYCDICRRNSHSLGAACRSCGATRTNTAPRYARVWLTGYASDSGAQKVADYLGRSIGREAKVVRSILADLPFKLSHHLDFEQATDMKRRLAELGAELQIEPIREKDLPQPGQKMPYGPLMRRSADAPGLRAPSTPGMAERRPVKGSVYRWAAAGFVAGATFGLAIGYLVFGS